MEKLSLWRRLKRNMKNFLLTLPLHQFLPKISSLKILTPFW
uniref:Lipin 2 n=1 Tax=Myotis myotis TaxID=51298 RepID=A0A7J7VYW7_MYOMY|nr:lipin 2 [Myotis myotis]